ncbi:MAG: AAA family ATPase [Thermoplasmata archaeon]
MRYNKYLEEQLELKYQEILLIKEKTQQKEIELMKNEDVNHLNDNTTTVIPDDLFDDIENYDDLKYILLIALRKNKRTAVLFIGPPATAKTMFLYDLLKLDNSMIISAYNTTKAGLRDVFLNYNPKYLCIDEIEKADAETTHTLLSVIENGIVQKTVAGQHIEKKVNPIIFATCNNTNKLSDALLSRFAVFNLRTYNREELFKIGIRIANKENIALELREQIINIILDSNILRDPRDFVNIFNIVHTNNIDEFKKDFETMKKYSFKLLKK